VVAGDASSHIVGHTGTRDWSPKGKPARVQTSLSGERFYVYGGLTKDDFIYGYHDRANSAAFIEFLKLLREKLGKVMVLVDNASPHKSKKTKEYVESCNGDVVLVYQLPYTPELNPVEGQWKTIRKCVGNRLFENVEKMQAAITKMLENGECKIVKMYDYLT